MDDTQSAAAATTYWCYQCNQRVEIEQETLECPLCQSGFVEQISSSREHNQISEDFLGSGGENGPDSDNTLSLWAPVLIGMMSDPRRRRRFRRRSEFEYEDNDDILSSVDEDDTELDRELQAFTRTRRRNLATMLQILQGIRSGTIYDSNNISEDDSGNSEMRDRGDPVILINPLNQTIIVQGGNFRNRDHNSGGSLGDYFVGPSLDSLLQHLADNDPNRYGTPPAKKEAVEAMPMVKIKENVQCSVCLDDLEMGTEVKEMPCKHKFHDGCILPWLELHSSCPVCRYQLPSDSSKIESDQFPSNNNSNTNINNNITSYFYDNNSSSSSGGGGEERNGRDNRRGFWPFTNLFSTSGNRGSSSSSSSNATRNEPSADEL